VVHVILLGDSIFDNARYVPDRPAVIDQVRQWLPVGWRATLLAVDGHTAADVAGQLAGLPADATHLVVSAGGNDALGAAGLLMVPAVTVGEALALLEGVRGEFRGVYRAMLGAVAAAGRPAVVCTIYDAVPGLGPAERAALAGFNEVILREAVAAGVPVVDLRVVCDQVDDYSAVSAIEPSAVGGAKIARTIVAAVSGAAGRSVVYG